MHYNVSRKNLYTIGKKLIKIMILQRIYSLMDHMRIELFFKFIFMSRVASSNAPYVSKMAFSFFISERGFLCYRVL
jgi:hypothetical protein